MTLVLCTAYLGIGCVLLFSTLRRTWVSPLSLWFDSYGLYALISLSAMVWPLLLAPKVREAGKERIMGWWLRRNRESRLKAGLTFSAIGGTCNIHCSECAFSERITSFTHGYADNGERNCYEGRQCLSCGKFDVIYGQGEPIRREERPCECGGTLSRDHKLFCPSCRTQSLSYTPGAIT